MPARHLLLSPGYAMCSLLLLRHGAVRPHMPPIAAAATTTLSQRAGGEGICCWDGLPPLPPLTAAPLQLILHSAGQNELF